MRGATEPPADSTSSNAFDWLIPGKLGACVNPSVGTQAAAAARRGRVGLLINLHERANPAAVLDELQAEELHLPVPSTYAPTEEQLERGVAAIRDALSRGIPVVVHCGAGLGRTGTLLAAYLVSEGCTADEAICRVRAARRGSIETLEQEQAVHEFARRAAPGD